METTYTQLSLEERCTIALLYKEGQSLRKIAATLDRQPSTISRELKRNTHSQTTGYRPVYADDQAWARRWRDSRLVRHPELQKYVLEHLAMGWSPEQVAGRMRIENHSMTISHESIYRFIDAQIRRTKDYRWRLYLPRAKSKRGYRGRGGGSSVSLISGRVDIDQRPKSILTRDEYGHWEADLIMASDCKHNLLVMHERKSRMTFLHWNKDKKADHILRALSKKLTPVPKQIRQTMTFDNGTEFARHQNLQKKLGIHTYFCHPHKPWQKGGVENINGRIRRFMPLKTKPHHINQKKIQQLQDIINSTPRKCLGFRTPLEVFNKLLHFECESTLPPTRE